MFRLIRRCHLIALLGAVILLTGRAEANGPNVLFIAVDDLGAALGCLGDTTARTPNLDRLARSGVLFERAYCQIPLCNPSRASVLTGLRPDRLQVFDLDRHFRDTAADHITLPQLFRRAGWTSGRIGKIYHDDVPWGIGSDGLDDPASWNWVLNPKGRDVEDEALIFNPTPEKKISAALSWLAAEGQDEEQTDGLSVNEAIRFLAEVGNQPFFLGVGLFRPHTPFVAPKRYFDLHPLEDVQLPVTPVSDRDDIPAAAFAHNNPIPNYGLDEATCRQALQAYRACVSFVDAQIGRLLDALEREGQAERTIVVVWSDHGYHLGEHGGIWQKRTLFEESARTPLFIRAPGARGNGRVCRRVVELVDLYPTLADLCGLRPPPNLAGRSLRPLLDDPESAWLGVATTQILRPGDGRPVMGRSLRTDRWRYTEWNEGEAGVELYDHDADPGELVNLAGTAVASEVTGPLREILRRKARGRPPVQGSYRPERL
jgi:iduronate 2-sulfatase